MSTECGTKKFFEIYSTTSALLLCGVLSNFFYERGFYFVERSGVSFLENEGFVDNVVKIDEAFEDKIGVEFGIFFLGVFEKHLKRVLFEDEENVCVVLGGRTAHDCGEFHGGDISNGGNGETGFFYRCFQHRVVIGHKADLYRLISNDTDRIRFLLNFED